MNRFAARSFAKLTLVFALMMALATSSFAHRFAAEQIDDSLRDYLAAGGSLTDLCAALDADGHSGQSCDACRLVDAAALPVVHTKPCDGIARLSILERPKVVLDRLPFASVFSHPVRAPPLA